MIVGHRVEQRFESARRQKPLYLTLIVFGFLSFFALEVGSSELEHLEVPPKTLPESNAEEHNSDQSKSKSVHSISPNSISQILRLQSETAQKAALKQSLSQLTENDGFELLDKYLSIRAVDQHKVLHATLFSRLINLNYRRTLRKFNASSYDVQVLLIDSIYAHVEQANELVALQFLSELTWDFQERGLFSFLSTRRTFTTAELIEFAKIVPALVVPLLAELEGTMRDYVLAQKLILHWVNIDVATTVDLIKELHTTTGSDRYLRRTTLSLAYVHPGEGLKLTQDYVRDFGTNLEARVFDSIAKLKPNKALELLPLVRRVFRVTRNNDLPKTIFRLSPKHAADFGLELPKTDSEWYFKWLERSYCKTDPQIFMDVMDRIPFPTTVSEISRCLLFESSRNLKLTKKDFYQLYKHLLKEDREAIDQYPKSDFIQGRKK